MDNKEYWERFFEEEFDLCHEEFDEVEAERSYFFDIDMEDYSRHISTSNYKVKIDEIETINGQNTIISGKGVATYLVVGNFSNDAQDPDYRERGTDENSSIFLFKIYLERNNMRNSKWEIEVI